MRRILISSVACHPSPGSESLVGYKTIEALSEIPDLSLSVIAANPSKVPCGVAHYSINIGSCSLNDIPPFNLLRFEIGQLRVLKKLRQKGLSFDLIYRITPSSLGFPTKLPIRNIPYIRGPVISAPTPPNSFTDLLRRPTDSSQVSRLNPVRVLNGLSAKFLNRLSNRDEQFENASAILTGNGDALKSIPEAYRSKCIPVTYAGVENDVFTPSQLIKSNIGKKTLQLLSVGRIIPYKGCELLLRSVAEASKTSSIQLTLVGHADAVYKKWCEQLISELGIGHIVTFIPPQPRVELVKLYQQADVFCFTTLCDTYGLALLEAMSCGCAVIATDVAGAGEIVNGVNGIKIPLLNPDNYIQTFANHIKHLSSDANKLQAHSEAARQHIVENHNWHLIREQIANAFKFTVSKGIFHNFIT